MREAADRALAVLAGLPPNKELAMAYVAQAQVKFRMNHLAESAAWAGKACDLARELGEGEIDDPRQRHARHRKARSGRPHRLDGTGWRLTLRPRCRLGGPRGS